MVIPVFYLKQRGEVVTSRYQNFWISTNRGPAKMAEKRKTMKECMTFLCMIAPRNKTVAQEALRSSQISREEEGTGLFNVRQCKWPSLSRKDCSDPEILLPW